MNPLRSIHDQLISMANECNWPGFYVKTIYVLVGVFIASCIAWAFTVPMHYRP